MLGVGEKGKERLKLRVFHIHYIDDIIYCNIFLIIVN